MEIKVDSGSKAITLYIHIILFRISQNFQFISEFEQFNLIQFLASI